MQPHLYFHIKSHHPQYTFFLFRYLKEICATLSAIVEKNQTATWSAFVKELEELILKQYDGLKTPTDYKGDWKARFKACAKLLNIKIASDPHNHWEVLTAQLREKRKKFRADAKIATTALKVDSSSEEQSNFSSSSIKTPKPSTCSKTNSTLSSVEKQNIIRYMENFKEKDKWKLTSGIYVEDQMLLLVKESSYEHPVHSLIMDPTDKVWKNYFTDAELKEILMHDIKQLPDLSEEMEEILQQFEFQGKTALEFYEFADNIKAHPINEFNKKWTKESIKSACELFFGCEELVLDDCSESDLLHSVWEFMHRLYQQKGIKAKLGERVSKAVSSAKNAGRAIKAIERRLRKAMGAKLDILFKAGIHELGSCEVGKHGVDESDDKYINDGLLKLPKTLRDMLAVQIRSNPSKINDLVAVGYLMMGKFFLSNIATAGHTNKNSSLLFIKIRAEHGTCGNERPKGKAHC